MTQYHLAALICNTSKVKTEVKTSTKGQLKILQKWFISARVKNRGPTKELKPQYLFTVKVAALQTPNSIDQIDLIHYRLLLPLVPPVCWTW